MKNKKSILFISLYYEGYNEKLNLSKLKQQFYAAKKLGFDTWYISYQKDGIYLCNLDGKMEFLSKPSISSIRTVQFRKIYNALNKIDKLGKKFNYIYIRRLFAMPSLVKALYNIHRTDAKIIMEVPTYQKCPEWKSCKQVWRRPLYQISEWMHVVASQYIDLYALIGEHESNYNYRKTINIENGINIDSIPARVPKPIEDEYHILGLANMQHYHGYDKLIIAIKNYYNNGGREKIIFHLVGDDYDGSLLKWKEMVHDTGLDKVVLFEGYMKDEALNEIVNTCDIGVASLAGYRKKMYVTSELKIREYLARGLPFIYSAEDYGLIDAPNCCYKVSNSDEAYIDINELLDFIRSTRSDNLLPLHMRQFAIENLSWEKQLEKVIHFV